MPNHLNTLASQDKQHLLGSYTDNSWNYTSNQGFNINMHFFSLWFRLTGFAVNPSVNNCILCFITESTSPDLLRASVQAPCPICPHQTVPWHEENEQKALKAKRAQSISPTWKLQANQPFFPSAGSSGSHTELQFDSCGNQRWFFNACNTDCEAILCQSWNLRE